MTHAQTSSNVQTGARSLGLTDSHTRSALTRGPTFGVALRSDTDNVSFFPNRNSYTRLLSRRRRHPVAGRATVLWIDALREIVRAKHAHTRKKKKKRKQDARRRHARLYAKRPPHFSETRLSYPLFCFVFVVLPQRSCLEQSQSS